MNVLISAIRKVRHDISSTERQGCRLLLALLLIIVYDPPDAAPLPVHGNVTPVAASAEFPGMAEFCWIDDLIEVAIREKRLPGAVVLVGQNEHILYRKAFGHRAVVPDLEPMTIDTIFDLGSLTKVVATTTSIMQLAETGRISLEDAVTKFMPQFKPHGKSEITVRHLLTHMSGLKSGLNLTRRWKGYRAAIKQIADDLPMTRPVRLGLEIAFILYRLYPSKYHLEEEEKLLGSETVLSKILVGKDPAAIVNTWQADEKHWRQLRRPYLLYPF